MRHICVLVVLVCAAGFGAQTTDNPEMARAKAEVDRLSALVKLGAAPRLHLEKAENALADAEDGAILQKTLYGQDLTEAQTDEMMSAADRRLERRAKALESAQKLVDSGAGARASLDKPRQDVELARKERDLATSRADLVKEVASMARAEESYAAVYARYLFTKHFDIPVCG